MDEVCQDRLKGILAFVDGQTQEMDCPIKNQMQIVYASDRTHTEQNQKDRFSAMRYPYLYP